MARKKRKLDQFLHQRKQNQEVVLEEKTELSNRIFRSAVWSVLTLLMGLLAVPVEWPSRISHGVGIGILFLVLSLLGCLYINRLQPGVFDKPSTFNKFVLVVAATLALHTFVKAMGWSAYLVPLPMFAMVVALAYGQACGLFFASALCFYIGLTSPRLADWVEVESMGFTPEGVPLPQSYPLDVPLMVALFAGALTAILGVRRVRKQSKPAVVGFFSGSVQALIVISSGFMLRGFSFEDLHDPVALRRFLQEPSWAFAGGLVSGSVVTCLLPAIEGFFGVLTDRRLLDLADPSNDLLRVLRERAPGTYQHTLGVAQLAGDAAEAMGANRLISQVGAYYHDIGKIFKPEYYVENMGEDKTIHDRLRPSMSKMIIISHVKDGIDLAEEAKLPEKIVDMIPMHHGTTLVEYFYHKARREAVPSEESPDESEYRYPGAKPHFREAGIVMLADMVEAIAKTEAEPNPSRFRALVHDQILKRLLDGQLDESDLTLNDLRLMEESFVRTLTNMYHHRIKYPEPQAENSSQETQEGSGTASPAAARAPR